MQKLSPTLKARHDLKPNPGHTLRALTAFWDAWRCGVDRTLLVAMLQNYIALAEGISAPALLTNIFAVHDEELVKLIVDRIMSNRLKDNGTIHPSDAEILVEVLRIETTPLMVARIVKSMGLEEPRSTGSDESTVRSIYIEMPGNSIVAEIQFQISNDFWTDYWSVLVTACSGPGVEHLRNQRLVFSTPRKLADILDGLRRVVEAG